jgi:hypothetical protein
MPALKVKIGGIWVPVSGGSTPADASETVKGIAELATEAEVLAGTDSTRIVTPAGLQAKIATLGSGGGVTEETVIALIIALS